MWQPRTWIITLVVVAAALFTLGCNSGECETIDVPMVWIDGSVSTMTLTVCQP